VARKAKPQKKIVYVPPPRYPFPRVRRFFWRLNIIRRLRFASHRGAYEGNKYWLGVTIVFALAGVLKKVLTKSPTLVATEVLKPGQAIVLRTIPPEARRRR
jgi:hypothetical protein